MKHFLALVLVISLCMTILPSFAEDINEDTSLVDPDISEITLSENTYKAWIDLSWPIVYSCYARATWLDNTSYFRKNYDYYSLSFLLLEDPLTATGIQAITAKELYSYLKNDYVVNKYTSGGCEFVLHNAYLTLHKTPAALNVLLTLHDTITVPDEYKNVDVMMIATISNLLSVSTKFRQQIQSKETVEGWRSPLKRENPEALNALFNIIK